MVSIMALSCLGANRAIGVEPQQKYEPVLQLLLQANNLDADRAPRYVRFITSPSVEARDPGHNVSIETIRREQGVDQFGLVKIDIEGGEIDLFREPDWLAYTQNIAMEVHPAAGDLSGIASGLKDFGFTFVCVDQSGEHRNINDAMFVYASRNGSLIPSIQNGNRRLRAPKRPQSIQVGSCRSLVPVPSRVLVGARRQFCIGHGHRAA